MNKHAGCMSAYEKEKRRADFAEARLSALSGEIYSLAHKMDGLEGHKVYVSLQGKSLGGAVRNLLDRGK